MVASKYKFLTLIGRCFVLLVGLAAVLVSAIFFHQLLENFELAVLHVALICLMLSMLFLYVGKDAGKSVWIDTDSRTLKISYFSIYSRRYTHDDLTGFIPQPTTNKMGTFAGILIQTTSGEQLHISELEFRNYTALAEVIATITTYNPAIKANIFTPFARVFYVYTGLTVSIIVVLKVLIG